MTDIDSAADKRLPIYEDPPGIFWQVVDASTGRARRITPFSSRGGFRRPGPSERFFPPSNHPTAQEAPQSADVLFGFLLSERPKTPQQVAEVLSKFSGTPRATIDAAAVRYIAACLSPITAPRSP